jgi:hypothetical protein
MVDAFHEETIIEVDDFRAKNVQPNSARDKNEVWPNSKAVPMTQLVSTSITIGR